MSDPAIHKCPNCGNDMLKIILQNGKMDGSENVWDLAHTGPGTTITSTTSGANYSGVSGPPGPPEASNRRVVLLVPYECPICHRKESYRE